jgi:hypothetical protein
MSDINTNVRLFDLVRHCRASLHEEGLITDKEYAWLCAEALMATSPSGGSPSARRLEDYDQLRERIKRLEEAGDKLSAAFEKEWLTDGDIEAIRDDWNQAKETKP